MIRAVEEAVRKFGRIDYAAHFAGVVGPPDTIVNLDIEKWKRCLDVNATGVMLCTKHVLIQMMKQDPIELYGSNKRGYEHNLGANAYQVRKDDQQHAALS